MRLYTLLHGHFYYQFFVHLMQVNKALSYVDKTMESLFTGLKEKKVENCINVMIVSDHGMAEYNSSKLVNLKKVSN